MSSCGGSAHFVRGVCQLTELANLVRVVKLVNDCVSLLLGARVEVCSVQRVGVENEALACVAPHRGLPVVARIDIARVHSSLNS